VTTAALSRPAPWRPLAIVTALATAAGVALGVAVAPDSPQAPQRPAPPPQPRVGLASGVAKLPLPADWRPLGRLSTLPGFEQATAVRAPGTEAALDIRLPEDASLLPASVVSAAGAALPAPTRRGPDGRTAWRYDLPGASPDTGIAAFALPTTGGVVTIACAATEGRLDRAAAACERAVSTVRLDDAAALRPTPETAAAIVLPDVIARLNGVRRSSRGRLAATTSPRARAAAGRRLATAYAAAAAALAPVAGGDARRVIATLTDLARDHRTLATAGLERRAAAQRRAGARIGRREQRLARGLRAVSGRRAAR
jgi:hypothetical protein